MVDYRYITPKTLAAVACLDANAPSSILQPSAAVGIWPNESRMIPERFPFHSHTTKAFSSVTAWVVPRSSVQAKRSAPHQISSQAVAATAPPCTPAGAVHNAPN
jgi:hypothetical protein